MKTFPGYFASAAAALALIFLSVPPAQAAFWGTNGPMKMARFNHTATLLPNGKVLVVGGASNTVPTAVSNVELFDPMTGTWTATHSLNSARCGHTATLLPNGTVLVAGGAATGNNALSSSE